MWFIKKGVDTLLKCEQRACNNPGVASVHRLRQPLAIRDTILLKAVVVNIISYKKH
jgi:hypothetical protein